MAPSNFHQPGGRGDREVRQEAVVSAKLEAESLVGKPRKETPDDANIKGVGGDVVYGMGTSDAHRKNNNFFAGIAEFFAGLGAKKSRVLDSGNNSDTTTCSTPVVALVHENPIGVSATSETSDSDESLLSVRRHNSSDPGVAMPHNSPERGTILSPRSPSVVIEGASLEGGPWQATANAASAESVNWRYNGLRADYHEDLSGGMEEVKESVWEGHGGNGDIDARQRMCNEEKRASFVVSFL